MNTKKETTQKADVKNVLAALWIAHFLLWTFGDMASLMQEITAPVENNLLLFVSVPLAITQAMMIFFSLVEKAKLMRWVNIILALVFALFNIGFIAEAQFGWEYLLGAGYLLFNGLIVWYAWKWPK